MAGRIRQEDVLAVRERTDIVKVVSGYLQLKKAGRDSMTGLCPFHPEKTPSFSVSPAKQVYHCFGCGEGGDVFRFLQRTENMSFGETVEKLAKDAGVTLRYEGETVADRRAQGHRQAIHRAIAEASRLYYRMLLEGREGADARDYLGKRGISRESAERFAIGYAPGYPDFLLKRMSKTFSVELMVEAGLVSKDGAGNLRDRFRTRVVFPIHDLAGNPVGFGGRLLSGPSGPGGSSGPGGPGGPSVGAAKYVNSPESAVYHKGSLLYNLNRAKAEITRTGRAWVVEGYTDVIALDQAGAPEAVATCGTALGEDHFRTLSRFTDRIVLAFDSDQAGARAAERAFQFHERYPVEVSVLVLPEGQDPADFVVAHGSGAEAGRALLALGAEATPLVEYMIERSLAGRDLSTFEEQSRAVKTGASIIAGLESASLRDKYVPLLADLVGVHPDAVGLEVDVALRAGGPQGPGPAPLASRRQSPQHKVEFEALKLLVQAPELCPGRAHTLAPEHFSRAEYRKAFEFILETGPGGNGSARSLGGSVPGAPGPGFPARGSPGTGALVAMAQDRSEQLGRLLAALAVEPPETLGEVSREYAEQVFLRLEEFALRGKVAEIRKHLERLNPLKSGDEYDALYEEFVRLEGARRRVRAAQEAIGGVT